MNYIKSQLNTILEELKKNDLDDKITIKFFASSVSTKHLNIDLSMLSDLRSFVYKAERILVNKTIIRNHKILSERG